jgi:hypothetical protein
MRLKVKVTRSDTVTLDLSALISARAADRAAGRRPRPVRLMSC